MVAGWCLLVILYHKLHYVACLSSWNVNTTWKCSLFFFHFSSHSHRQTAGKSWTINSVGAIWNCQKIVSDIPFLAENSWLWLFSEQHKIVLDWKFNRKKLCFFNLCINNQCIISSMSRSKFQIGRWRGCMGGKVENWPSALHLSHRTSQALHQALWCSFLMFQI